MSQSSVSASSPRLLGQVREIIRINAILFLYRDVLKITLPWLENVQRAKRPKHLPVVLTREEVKRTLAGLEGMVWLMAALTYGAGLRLMVCLRLRVKDLELDRGELLIRDGKDLWILEVA